MDAGVGTLMILAERLMKFLNSVDRNVEIAIPPKSRSRRNAKIVVPEDSRSPTHYSSAV
jgi:hypothetical protein